MNHPRQPARSVTATVRAMRGRPRGGLVAMPDPRTEDEQCLRGLADGFLSRMAARAYSPGSVEAHAWALKYFIDWAVSRRLLTPAAFTRPLLEEYQLFLHQFRSTRTGALLAVNTQLARLGVIRRFFAWLCRENIIPANPAADLDLPRKQARLLPKSLAIEEIDRLLALPDVSSPFGARDRALLELFYATGVRRTEMVRLELGDFDPAQRTLHVRRGKGGKSRLLPVGDRAARWLSHYLAEIRPLLAGHPGERALFLSGYGSPFSPAYLGNWVARQMKKAGIEKKGSCHLFRHSCATHMLEGGADIRYIQQMLGHARLDTTQIYTEVSIRALTEAHARSHPHGRLPVSGEGPVDSNGASGSLSPVPEPPIGPVSVLASVIPATTVSHPNEDPEEPTAMEVDSDKPPTDPAVGTFQGMLEACGWPDGTDGGVIEYGYRYLDTQLGRWLSRDPIGEAGGVNFYKFVGNAAPSQFDYLGLDGLQSEMQKGADAAKKATEDSEIDGFGRDSRNEYCGLVCCKDNVYRHTVPHSGTIAKGGWQNTGGISRVWVRTNGNSCDPFFDYEKQAAVSCAVFGEGWKTAGVFQSHPNESEMSPSDKQFPNTDFSKEPLPPPLVDGPLPLVVIMPSGRTLIMRPGDKEPTEIRPGDAPLPVEPKAPDSRPPNGARKARPTKSDQPQPKRSRPTKSR